MQTNSFLRRKTFVRTMKKYCSLFTIIFTLYSTSSSIPKIDLTINMIHSIFQPFYIRQNIHDHKGNTKETHFFREKIVEMSSFGNVSVLEFY